jgi:hypothetical protein
MFRSLPLVLACVIAVSGCAAKRKDPTVQTLNQQQAAERVDTVINTAVDQLRPRPSLDPYRKSTLDCDDPSDNGPLGRVTVEHRYLLPGIKADSGPAALDTLAKYWTDNGYRILRDGRGKPLAEVAAEGSDGFRVVISTNTLGQLYITGSSPCVWPSGSAPTAER